MRVSWWIYLKLFLLVRFEVSTITLFMWIVDVVTTRFSVYRSRKFSVRTAAPYGGGLWCISGPIAVVLVCCACCDRVRLLAEQPPYCTRRQQRVSRVSAAQSHSARSEPLNQVVPQTVASTLLLSRIGLLSDDLTLNDYSNCPFVSTATILSLRWHFSAVLCVQETPTEEISVGVQLSILRQPLRGCVSEFNKRGFVLCRNIHHYR